MTDNLSQPVANSPEARTPEGTLIDQASTQTSSTNSTTETTPATEIPDGTTPTAKAPAATAAPDTYTFTAPEGQEVNKALADAATPIFKELGLDQAAADKLTALWNIHARADADRALEVIKAQSAKWTAAVKADPELGPNMDKIGVEVGRALDSVLTKDQRAAFNREMDQTGFGNNPEVVRAIYKLAAKVTEGTHVSGVGPVGAGPDGRLAGQQRPTLAAALYPNLKSAAS